MIFNKIISDIPEGLTKLEIARYLYIKLCSIVCFDTVINNTDNNNFYHLYNMEIDPLSYNDIYVNCHTWSQLYSSLLNYFNIQNKIVRYWHSYVNFYIDEVKWVADSSFGCYCDLSRIHYGDQTILFGPCIYQDSHVDSNVVCMAEMYQNLLDSIDSKIGYYDKSLKIIEFKKKLCSIKYNQSYDIVSKLEFLFSCIGNLSFGYYEAKDFVFELEKNILTDKEFNNVGVVELKRNKSINDIDIIECIFVKYNGSYKYYILCPLLPIKAISSDELSLLYLCGFDNDKKNIPGFIPQQFDITDCSSLASLSSCELIRKNVKAYKRN